MTCPHCQAPVPAGARFCPNCGQGLPSVCPSCGTATMSGAKFCFNCGYALSEATPDPVVSRLRQHIPSELLAKLEAARSRRTMEGERRIVTALFCDVQGSTSMAESMDPEEWTDIINGAFQHLINPVYRYEGMLARILGDGILAFFGAPIAHEDDPRRAVLAGLDIVHGLEPYREEVRRTHNIDLNVRVGINTGLAVVGEVGSDLHVEYTATGDAVNVAARMEQTADPNTVRISGNTYRLVTTLFETESLGSISVKGKSVPVPAYRVVAAKRNAIPERGIEGLYSPLVGRSAQLELVEDRVERLRAGNGHIVSVMGEAGLGKSRLLAEVHNSMAARGYLTDTGAIRSFEGRSFSFQMATPYALVRSLLQNILGIDETESRGESYSHLRSRVEEIMRGRADTVAPYLATLLNISLPNEEIEIVRHLEPPHLRMLAFSAVSDLLAALIALHPTLLVLEDLHWADSASLDLIESILPLTQSAPLLVVAVFRPHHDDPSWRFHLAASDRFPESYTTIKLEPLSEEESRTFVANLLHIEDLPERVRSLILQKAEGNPFYVEEVIRSLLDSELVVHVDGHWRATSEIENVSVPDTLTGVITARLDRLQSEPHRVAQEAAVIGREFAHAVLSGVHPTGGLDPSLVELRSRDLIVDRSNGHQVYRFKHVLTQEAAYDSILRRERSAIHARVAECLERVAPDRVEEIARHYLEARDEVRALPHTVAAGDRALRAYASGTAAEWFRRALDIATRVDASQYLRRLYEGLAKTQELEGDYGEAVETYQSMRDAAVKMGDVPMEVSALNKLAKIEGLHLGKMEAAFSYLNVAEAMARDNLDGHGHMEAAVIKCGACMFAGQFDQGLAALGESVQTARALDLKEVLVEGLTHTATMLAFTTEFDASWEVTHEALQVADEIGNLEQRADILGALIPFGLMRNGDLRGAARSAREGIALAHKIGVVFVEATCSMLMVPLLSALGEYEDAITTSRRTIELIKAMGPYGAPMLPAALSSLGSIYFAISPELYQETAAEHEQQFTPMEEMAGASGWADMGFIALESGQMDRAKDLFARGLSTPSMAMLIERPRLLVGSALCSLMSGDVEGATSLVHEAEQFTLDRGMQFMYPVVDFARANLEMVLGNMPEALVACRHADEEATRMGMRPMMAQARALRAQIAEKVGRRDEAESSMDGARQVRDEIAGLFRDERLRAAYLADKERKGQEAAR